VHGLCEGLGVEVRVVAGGDPEVAAATYWGRFHRGAKEGLGVCKWQEGSRYSGEWRTGQISGRGVLISDGGSRSYRGLWLRAMKHGRGVYSWPDGRQHGGQYKLDSAHGFGSLEWPDGQRYDGFWRNAFATGQGVFTHTDGAQGPLPSGLLHSSMHDGSEESVQLRQRDKSQEEEIEKCKTMVKALKLADPQGTGVDRVESQESQEEPSTAAATPMSSMSECMSELSVPEESKGFLPDLNETMEALAKSVDSLESASPAGRTSKKDRPAVLQVRFAAKAGA